MSRYRKKPVVIEASRWFRNGDHPRDYEDQTEQAKDGLWEGSVVRYYRTPDLDGQAKCGYCGDIMHNHGWIDTLEGGHIVCPGDWIITGVQGEVYPCKSDIFEATYEAVEPAVKHHFTITPYDPLNRVAACSCRWHRLVGSTREAERLHAAHVLEARSGGQMTLTEWREEVA